MKRLFFIIFVLGFFISAAYAGEVYKWVDKEGVVNYTDDFNKVPPAYQDRLQIEKQEEPSSTGPSVPSQPPPTSQPSLQKSEEPGTDINGHDEAWWRARVRPWRERLKEATEKYEEANKRFLERSEELSRQQQGARTGFRYRLRELDGLDEERKKYEAEVTEADQMLKKLLKEAEEAKANPDWLH